VKQVFYVEEVKEEGWSHVIKIRLGDLYDLQSVPQHSYDDDDGCTYTQCLPYIFYLINTL